MVVAVGVDASVCGETADGSLARRDSRMLQTVREAIAHGDVLQILQTDFSGVDVRQHRSLEHLQTATLRELVKV